MKLTVDIPERIAKMRAHTATHLLHAVLNHILGETRQAWSYVDDDMLRFDFTTKKPLSPEQIQTVNILVNNWIRTWAKVTISTMSIEEANQTWAKAFFEDKYGDIVRIIQIENLTTQDNIHIWSQELCGGTHVLDTSHIWWFIIDDQSAVASGVRRITAYTWPRVAEIAVSKQNRISQLSERIDCQPSQLEEKLEKILKAYAHIQQDYESLESTIIQNHLHEEQKTADSRQWVDFCIYISDESHLAHHDYKTIVHQAKQIWSDQDRLIYTVSGAFALYTWASNTAKILSKQWWVRGWGSNQFVQGKDENIKNVE